MLLDKSKFANYYCSQYKSEYDSEEKRNGIETISLGDLQDQVYHMVKNANLNNKDIYTVPVFVLNNQEMYCIEGTSTSFGKLGMTCGLLTEFQGKYNQRVYYVAPDERPEKGEYWISRGVSDFDVSGFIKSKKAGERLLRMVKLVLETDEPKSWLDYRESEPNWIQFKFQDTEFNLEALNKLVKLNNDIITLEILYQTKL